MKRERAQLLPAIAASIAVQTPTYNAGVADPDLLHLRARVLRHSLDTLIEQIAKDEAGEAVDFSEHIELGREEYRHARPLGDLLQTPWGAALGIWQFFVDAAQQAHLDAPTLNRLAAIVIQWSGRISMALSEGYHDEMAASAGTLEARRRRLVELLLRDPPASSSELASAAEDAGWRLPKRLSVLVTSGDNVDVLRRRLPAGSLAGEVSGCLVALLPPTTRSSDLDQLSELLQSGTAAAVGPEVDTSEARMSAARAEAALKLARDGTLDSSRVIRAEDHTLELMILADRTMARDHANRWLSALETARPSMQAQLEATLASWLRHQGSASATAHELGVHPHTVGYRVGRLRELLGDVLDDPDRRFELLIALRARLLLAEPPAGQDDEPRSE